MGHAVLGGSPRGLQNRPHHFASGTHAGYRCNGEQVDAKANPVEQVGPVFRSALDKADDVPDGVGGGEYRTGDGQYLRDGDDGAPVDQMAGEVGQPLRQQFGAGADIVLVEGLGGGDDAGAFIHGGYPR
ncbi:hypothetical protein D3C80_1221650 [compost metagenome]